MIGGSIDVDPEISAVPAKRCPEVGSSFRDQSWRTIDSALRAQQRRCLKSHKNSVKRRNLAHDVPQVGRSEEIGLRSFDYYSTISEQEEHDKEVNHRRLP